ncbi:hypothetical protein K3720_01860 [Leisingera caerulea]|uniref:hypothetical protein n=1 Tax=Leisingera caerulea TaxID=506591 RepID=UPI0021A79994|nr:hypothetical protein [Leisingera caerulea]UWQ50177.1 hypothetical protein K3720_01860 [Leisingera caerulea]
MAEKKSDPFWRLNNPIMWGVLATIAVIFFGVWAANQSVCQTDFWGSQSCGGSKWSAFLEAAPNEVGDTLAGFAGALAFVWLIVTVWLQATELREQRDEFEKMAKAQDAQLKLVSSQQEDVNQDAVLLGVMRRFQSLNENTVSYLAHPVGQPYSHVGGRISPRGANPQVVEFYQDLNKCLVKAVNRQHEGRLDLEESISRGFGGEKAQLLEALWYMEGLVKNKSSLSLAGNMHQSDMKLEHSAMLLREIVTILSQTEESKK